MRNDSSLGRGWSFPPQFDSKSRELTSVRELEDIQQSLYILLRTEPGERVMQPEYGCALRLFLFESIVSSTLTRLQDVVNKAILRFEPRVVADPAHIDTSRMADGVLLLDVSYTVRSLTSRHNIVVTLYLQKATLQQALPTASAATLPSAGLDNLTRSQVNAARPRLCEQRYLAGRAAGGGPAARTCSSTSAPCRSYWPTSPVFRSRCAFTKGHQPATQLLRQL